MLRSLRKNTICQTNHVDIKGAPGAYKDEVTCDID